MRTIVLTLIGSLVLTVAPLAAQPAMPKPGPEHEMLKKFEGDWEVSVAFGGGQSKGTANSRVTLGGFWLVERFQGEFGGMKFEGRETTGYDPNKKKFVQTWVDSTSPSLTLLEGSFSKDGKTLTTTGEGPGMDGKMEKMKAVYEFKDNDNYLFTIYHTVNGKEQEMMKIAYARKK